MHGIPEENKGINNPRSKHNKIKQKFFSKFIKFNILRFK